MTREGMSQTQKIVAGKLVAMADDMHASKKFIGVSSAGLQCMSPNDKTVSFLARGSSHYPASRTKILDNIYISFQKIYTSLVQIFFEKISKRGLFFMSTLDNLQFDTGSRLDYLTREIGGNRAYTGSHSE